MDNFIWLCKAMGFLVIEHDSYYEIIVRERRYTEPVYIVKKPPEKDKDDTQ